MRRVESMTITRRERDGLASRPSFPDWPRRVDEIAKRRLVPFGDRSRGRAVGYDLTKLRKQTGTRRMLDGAIETATPRAFRCYLRSESHRHLAPTRNRERREDGDILRL